MGLTKKKLISMSVEEAKRLRELAQANTSGNEAALIRSLLNRAYLLPTDFGLIDPEVFVVALGP